MKETGLKKDALALSDQQQFWRWIWVGVACCTWLLLPTALMVDFSIQQQQPVSRLISTAWGSGLQYTLVSAGLHLPKLTMTIISDGLAYLIILIFSGCYGIGYFYLRQSQTFSAPAIPNFNKNLLWIIAILGVVLMGVVPFHSRDIYGYINRGAQQAFYGLNPYLTAVGEMRHWQDDLIFQEHWVDNPCPYGFFYAQWAKLLVLLGQHHFFLTFLIFKASNIGVHLLNTWLVYQLANRLKRPDPQHLMYLYGLHPLILFHQLANGHNDGLLALGTLSALWVFIPNKRRSVTSLPILLGSILTKYISLLALPWLLLWGIAEKRWKMLWLSAGISLLLFTVLAWPYAQDLHHLPWDKMVENAGKSQHSIQAALARAVFYLFGELANDKEALLNSSRSLLKTIFSLAFIGFMALRLVGFVNSVWGKQAKQGEVLNQKKATVSQTTTDSLLQDKSELSDAILFEIALMMSIYTLVASAKFHPWYFGMFFPILFLLNPKTPKHALLFKTVFYISLFQILSFTPLENIHIIGVLLTLILPTWLALKPIFSKNKTAEPIHHERRLETDYPNTF